jgi:HKD family nuclease
MAKSKFILQGFTPRNHIEAVRRLFEADGLDRVIMSVAFANQGGVELLAPQIEPVGSKVTAFVGIRNPITSRQALARLLELGVSLIAVDTGSPNVLFHPKLYFARGAEEARLVIGSANLTPGGLNNNIEAGMATDLDLSDEDDSALADEIEKEFDDSLTKFPANVFAVETEAAIQALQDANRVIDETAIRERSEAQKEAEAETGAETSGETSEGTNGSIAPIKLLVTPIRSPVRQTGGGTVRTPPAPGRGTAAPATPPAPAAPVTPAAPAAPALELVWRSGALSERDLNIPRGSNTALTGSMLFKQGRYAHIDQRHYFRDDVFRTLTWRPDARPDRRHLERASARFTIIIDGVDQGEYRLRLTHNSDTTSRAYEQSNSMTQVHWEGVTHIIRDRALLGKTMELYRDNNDPEHFVIEIS